MADRLCTPPLPPGYITLPYSVEDLLARICKFQSLSPPDNGARRVLAGLREEDAVQILNQIADLRVRNLSGLINHMAKNSVVATNGEAVVPQESGCFLRPRDSCSASKRDESSISPLSCRISSVESMSPLVALGKLEFRKAFLILSYTGGNKLEEAISVNLINEIKCLPMVSFEKRVWASVGHRCIPESDRRKSLDWDTRKTHVYHCHVDQDGNLTFKGPYLQPTRTHLQRVLGDDNVLLVKFAEDSNRKRFTPSAETFNVYHRIAKEGILVGLRHYHFFVFKDGGKEEKKESQTSSPVKCYFVRMESHWAMDVDKPYILSNRSIYDARSIFMHVQTTSSLAKYMARFSLILSKTIKFDIDLACVHIEEIEDVPCMDDMGGIIYNEDGEIMIHTDGTGLISEDLAKECPGNIFKGKIQTRLDGLDLFDRPSTSRRGGAPLLIQFRLFNNGCAAKGTLLVDKRLPEKTIHIRPSMVKVNPAPTFSQIQSCNSLELVATSNQPKRTYLSRYLIALLNYGGVPKEYFLELLANALDDVKNARYSQRSALGVALRYGNMDDFLVARMIFCGIPLDEPYLLYRLSVQMKEERKGLKGGKLPVSECYYLMGTTDPTGTLKPDEVCIILDNGQISGEVLVYKSPGLHFGDIHLLTATYIKNLESIVGNAKYAILFPIKGPRSLADEMANSDYDGDMYWISRNPQLLEYFRPSEPWVPTTTKRKIPQPKPSMFSDTELERELFQLFLINRFEPSYAISTAADSWLVFMDRLLTLGIECTEEKKCLRSKMLQLVDIYYDALDAGKTGLKVKVPEGLKPEKYPHFMERGNKYTSTSVLGLIYEKVDSYMIDDLPPHEIWLLPCFTREAPSPCLALWKKYYADYRSEMSHAMSADEKSKDPMAKEVIQKYKQILYGAAEFEQSTKNYGDIFDEALAIYQINYNYAKTVGDVGRCHFAWTVAGQALCVMHAREQQGQNSPIVCVSSILRELLG